MALALAAVAAVACWLQAMTTRNDHFETVADWAAAGALVAFQPRRPSFTAGFALQSIAIQVMDQRRCRLPVGTRSLEAHYGGFVVDQTRLASAEEARLRALSVPYGTTFESVWVARCEGRAYPRGPEPDLDDVDGRAPAVVVWSDGPMFYLVASDQLDDAALLRIASSMYETLRK